MGIGDVLRKALGLGEDASEDDIAAKLAEGLKSAPEPKNEPPTSAPNGHDGVTQKQLDEALALLRRNNDEVSRQQVDAIVKQLQEQNQQLSKSLRLSKVHSQVKALSEGSGHVLPIPQQEELLKILMEVSEETGNKIVKVFMDVKEKGLVELGERGTSLSDESITLDELSDPVAQFGKLVERKLAEGAGKVDYTTALKEVSAEKPQLYDAYRRAVDVKSGRR